ncbi:hypothetical protein ACQEVM_35570 [Streptomyces sp. CA-243310]|uniref:hypothetical protein n=1 Tax=Streptomyces sp. CA-243310 TaxID=3240056 RepID=UPI003D916294
MSDAGSKPHRHEVYLSWMTASAAQLPAAQLASSGIGWPEANPDLLELALLDGVRDPATILR